MFKATQVFRGGALSASPHLRVSPIVSLSRLCWFGCRFVLVLFGGHIRALLRGYSWFCPGELLLALPGRVWRVPVLCSVSLAPCGAQGLFLPLCSGNGLGSWVQTWVSHMQGMCPVRCPIALAFMAFRHCVKTVSMDSRPGPRLRRPLSDGFPLPVSPLSILVRGPGRGGSHAVACRCCWPIRLRLGSSSCSCSEIPMAPAVLSSRAIDSFLQSWGWQLGKHSAVYNSAYVGSRWGRGSVRRAAVSAWAPRRDRQLYGNRGLL